MLKSHFILTGLLAVWMLSLCPLMAQQWGDYTLYSAQNSSTAVLVDTNGTTYHTWTFDSQAKTGYSSYLMEGGTIVRSITKQNSVFNGGGMTGRFQMVDWNSNVLWDYSYSTSTYCAHHDFHVMPNGNVLIISYELKSAAEATQAGSKYSHVMWPDKIVEVQPEGASGGIVVWEWHVWDHLVQDYDPTKDNYGVVADHPELVDINYGNNPQTKDWMHCNGIDYNESLDQIVFSSHMLNELYVIDHSTTTAEAAGHAGGNSGKGGDILYRWGNPAVYDAPGQTIFHVVHDAHWVPDDCPQAGFLAGFNNNGISNNQSCIDLIDPPYSGYNYTLVPGSAYEPATYTWRHACNGHTSSLGNSQQLPNGNTLVCIAQSGIIYEINANQQMIWSKNVSGSVAMAFRYTKCFVEGTGYPKPSITLAGDSLMSSTAPHYRWFFEGDTIPGATGQYYKPLENGAYQVQVFDEGGCTSELSDPYDYQLLGWTESAVTGNISVYPNPVSGTLYIEGNLDASAVITLTDLCGRVILQESNVNSLDLSSLRDGLYLYRISTGGSLLKNGKIMLINR
jgi:hypothetical protein